MVARQVLSEQKVLNIVLLSRLRNVWPGRDTPSVSRKRVMPVPIISDGMRKPKVTSSKRGFIFESSSALLPIMSQQGAMVEGASRTHSFKSVPEHLLSSCSLDRVRAFCTYRILAAAATSAAWSAAAMVWMVSKDILAGFAMAGGALWQHFVHTTDAVLLAGYVDRFVLCLATCKAVLVATFFEVTGVIPPPTPHDSTTML